MARRIERSGDRFVTRLIAFALFFPIAFILFLIEKSREKTFLNWAVPRAVGIAQHQEWVSPHRLIIQAHMTLRMAQKVLVEATRQGYLQQHVNGRYYFTGKSFEQKTLKTKNEKPPKVETITYTIPKETDSSHNIPSGWWPKE